MSESITNRADAVAALGALPVPQGQERQPLSDRRLAEIRNRRLDEVTPGPWLVADGAGGRPVVYVEEPLDGIVGARVLLAAEGASEADVQFVASVRRSVPELLAEVDRLRPQVAALLAERHSTNESVDDAAKALRSQRDRIAELEAAAQAARAVHVKFTTSDHCQADAERWPCPTVVALDVVSPAAPEPEPGACTECGDGPSKWCPGCAKCSCVAEHDMGCARRVGEPA